MNQPWQDPFIIHHTQRLLYSFQHWTGRPLLDVQGSPLELAEQVFHAHLAVLSHGTEADPIFNYGNQLALQIWELTWAEFIQMPSRKTAEVVNQETRSQLLSTAQKQGYTPYSGVRISSTGRRFHIDDGILWNVIDPQGNLHGQAAIFSRYEYLP
ncbi:MAG: MEKHLA domain-containing protein [Thainema sp.]